MLRWNCCCLVLSNWRETNFKIKWPIKLFDYRLESPQLRRFSQFQQIGNLSSKDEPKNCLDVLRINLLTIFQLFRLTVNLFSFARQRPIVLMSLNRMKMFRVWIGFHVTVSFAVTIKARLKFTK